MQLKKTDHPHIENIRRQTRPISRMRTNTSSVTCEAPPASSSLWPSNSSEIFTAARNTADRHREAVERRDDRRSTREISYREPDEATLNAVAGTATPARSSSSSMVFIMFSYDGSVIHRPLMKIDGVA